MGNPVGWFEIYSSDIDRAKKFYEGVFEITLSPLTNPGIEASDGLQMWSFPEGDMNSYGATGAICIMPGIEPGGTGTIVYFSCEDCSIEEKRVEKFGGKLLKPKESIGQHGFITIAKDTEGNMIGLHSMK